jgi:lipopolysaccharide/colanic/teichoic acid biosynthesis glycosyltransferase
MHVFPIIIDSRLPYARSCGSDAGLLGMPAGHESLLGRTLRQARVVTFQKPLIAPDFRTDADYEARTTALAAGMCDLLAGGRFGEWLDRREPSDLLLLVDPRFCPLRTLDLREFVNAESDPRLARFLVAIDDGMVGAEEWAHLDEHGNVGRIQRYYNRVTRVHTRGVLAAVVPAASLALLNQRGIDSLPRLRTACSAAGVPCRDTALPIPAFDLHLARGLLDLNENCLAALNGRPIAGFERRGDLWIGAGADVHPSARLTGRVLIHAGARIEQDACIVGPTVVGADARVGPNAVVIQSVVAPGAAVVRLRSVRHQIAFTAEPDAPSSDRGEPTPPSAFSATSLTESAETTERQRPRRVVYRVLKRATDMVVAAVGLLVLSPLLLLVGLLVKVTSAGPVLFAHRREGEGGRPFACYKFRTMERDAHERQREMYHQNEIDGPQFMIPNDPRITVIGKWLRDWCVDEIPQLWNVLRGEMSLVGPRPSPFRENQICVPWREARLSVPPGITGLWQICRSKRSLGDFHQWIHFDILYVRNASYILDLKILLFTFLSLGGHFPVRTRWLLGRDRHSPWVELELRPADSRSKSRKADSGSAAA